MKILALSVSTFLLLSSSLFSAAFAKEENKDEVNSAPSKIQYVGEDSDQPENNSVFGGSNPINRYGGLPINYGPFMGPREILRNRFRGSDSNSDDENRDDESKNNQGTGGSTYPYPGTGGSTYPYPGSSGSTYPYPGSDGNTYPYPGSSGSTYPYPGNSRSAYPYPGNSGSTYPYNGSDGSSYPYPGTGGSNYPYPGNGGSNYPYPGNGGSSYPYPGTGGSRYPYSGTGGNSYPYPGVEGPEEVENGVFTNPFLGQRRRTSSTTPGYGSSEDETQTGYGRPSSGGSYRPSYGQQPGIYSSTPGYRPQADQGYIYPVGGNGIGIRQPDGTSGLGTGNGYGVYPGTFRNVPSSYVPTSGINGVYTGNPRSYGPELFGYGQYPGLLYPGLGFDYGRLRDSESHGDRGNESVDRKSAGLPYPQSTPSTEEASEEKKTKQLRKEDP